MGIGKRVNIPRPPLGEVRTSMSEPIVSGTRRGGSSETVWVLMRGPDANVSARFGLAVVVATVDVVNIGVVKPIL